MGIFYNPSPQGGYLYGRQLYKLIPYKCKSVTFDQYVSGICGTVWYYVRSASPMFLEAGSEIKAILLAIYLPHIIIC